MHSQESFSPLLRKRWFRFSLRSLLVLVTACAILIGWVAKERRQSAYEQEIVVQLQKQGVSDFEFCGPFDSSQLTFDDKPQGWWRDLARQYLGERIFSISHHTSDFFGVNETGIYLDLSLLAGLTSLKSLSLGGPTISDISPLAELTTLEELFLEDVKFSDLTPLSTLTNLHALSILSLQFRSISDISPLGRLTALESLSLNSIEVTDLMPLASLKRLHFLALYGRSNSDEQVAKLQQALPNCKFVK